MPYIHVKTNTDASANAESIKSKLGDAIRTIPGKSEQWLMVELTPHASLWFQGSSDPAAMVEVQLFGNAPSSAYESLTSKISSILSSELSIPQDRIYVSFFPTSDWGWNGRNL